MHTTLIPNILLRSNVEMKGKEISPLSAESFGRIEIGPCKKNFVLPNELVIILDISVIKGRAW